MADWNAPLPDFASHDGWRLQALYAWERRLRGYDLFSQPVALEPAFVPYNPERDAETGGWASVPQARDAHRADAAALTFLTLRLPLEQKVTPAQTSEFLSALRGLMNPLALEIIADGRSIRYQIACSPHDAVTIVGVCNHSFPRAHLGGDGEFSGAGKQVLHRGGAGQGDALLDPLTALTDGTVAQRVVDFGLFHPVYRPLRLFESFAADPHAALVGALGTLEPGEVAGLQVLVAPAEGGWGRSLALLVAQFDGVTGFAHPGTRDTYLERSLRYKVGLPLWAVALRVFAFSSGGGRNDEGREDRIEALADRSLDICRRLGAALDAFQSDEDHHDSGNQLVALEDEGYSARDRLRDLLDRRSRRAGMLLSQAELAGLWHPPSERLVHPRLLRYDPRHRALPDYLKDAPGVALGLLAQDETGSLPGAEPQLVHWPDAMRNRHLYTLGGTRMGKSTLLLNLIAQDMLADRGLCLIDPHGDLALDVLRRVPPEREKDVLYLDLSDTAHPPALGLLEAASEWEKRLLVSDLLAILHRLFRASWGDRLEHILRHALLTLLAARSSPFGTPLTLRDIRPLLASKVYRQRLLEEVPDPDLHTFWHSEFAGYTPAAFAPVYNKLGLLLSSPVVRNIIGGSQTRLHAGPLMQRRQILLVNLAQSLIGEDNAHFLGALLVSKIQLAAMHGLRLGREERQPFTLYVDEFQNFVVSSFEKILSEAGKAGLTLVMANQFLEQLGEDLPTAIRSNAGTLISFRVSAQSGRALEGEFGGLFGAKELTDLERGQAVARLGRAGDSFFIHTFPPLEPATLNTDSQAPERIQERTHANICRKRAEVEAELRAGDEALRGLLEAAAEAEKAAKEARKVKPDKEKSGAAGSAKPTRRAARADTGRRSPHEDDPAPAATPDMRMPDVGTADEPVADLEGSDLSTDPEPPSRSRKPPRSTRARRARGRAASTRRAATPPATQRKSGDVRAKHDRAGASEAEPGGAEPTASPDTPPIKAQSGGQPRAPQSAAPESPASGREGRSGSESARTDFQAREGANLADGNMADAPIAGPQPRETAPASPMLFFGLPEEGSQEDDEPENQGEGRTSQPPPASPPA